jgi:hypothetical protein
MTDAGNRILKAVLWMPSATIFWAAIEKIDDRPRGGFPVRNLVAALRNAPFFYAASVRSPDEIGRSALVSCDLLEYFEFWNASSFFNRHSTYADQAAVDCILDGSGFFLRGLSCGT